MGRRVMAVQQLRLGQPLSLDGQARRVLHDDVLPQLHTTILELNGAFDGVDWMVEAEAERRIGELPPLTAEVIYGAAREAVRNAARHGRGEEPGRSLQLTISAAWRGGLEIRVEDDGIGVEPERPGPGGGQGLALHSTMIGVIGGTMAVEAAAGGGTRVTLSLPGEW